MIIGVSAGEAASTLCRNDALGTLPSGFEDVSCRKERQLEITGGSFKSMRLAKFQNMFMTCAGNAGLHQPRGWGAQDNFAMSGDVVGMGVTYEDLVWPGLRLMRIKPEPEFRQTQVAVPEFKLESRHTKT